MAKTLICESSLIERFECPIEQCDRNHILNKDPNSYLQSERKISLDLFWSKGNIFNIEITIRKEKEAQRFPFVCIFNFLPFRKALDINSLGESIPCIMIYRVSLKKYPVRL